MNSAGPIEAVLWDIGGVLLDWDARHLYRKLFADEAEMERFLAEVCTMEWHAAHDRGVRFAQSCPELACAHPEYAAEIMAWGDRSAEMDRGEISGSVAVLAELRAHGVPCWAITNMEHETYPRRVARFPFMSWFDGTVVSAHEGVAKPDRRLYEIALQRFALDPPSTLTIDDSERNLRTAASLGLQTLHFHSPEQLRADLESLGLLPSARARR